MMTLPEVNQTYGTQDYWINRFEKEDVYEWLVDYNEVKDFLGKYIDKNSTILILGCGNSLLGEDLYRDGFKLIFSMDYCENVVTNMSTHCDYCSQINWLTMDATKMPIIDKSIDVVLEKATIDTFLVNEKNLWTLSSPTAKIIDKTLHEISRILKPNGKFISLSFNQPHFRGHLYSKEPYNWGISSIDTIGADFHHYLYVVQKGLSLSDAISCYTYEPPKVIQKQLENDTIVEGSEENDIFSIKL